MVAARLPLILAEELQGLADERRLPAVLRKGVQRMEQELFHSELDCQLSGCTLTCCLLYKRLLVSAQLGDSAAMIVSGRSSDYYHSFITVEQRPDDVNERAMILEKGGRVAVSRNGKGPLRVWLKDEWSPGLAMTRSLGDRLGKLAGMSA
jgi:serine/threonine protein phosphatase PrpC